jgi:hypothetical protein
MTIGPAKDARLADHRSGPTSGAARLSDMSLLSARSGTATVALASLRSVFDRQILVSPAASGSKLRSATFDRDALRLDSTATRPRFPPQGRS